MHDLSYIEMGKLIDKYLVCEPLKIADLGSWSYGGPEASYRKLMHSKWEYVGLDIRGNRDDNVDVKMSDPYEIPFPDKYFHAMISGSTLEHVHNPWKLAQEMNRVMKNSGILIIQAPFVEALHDKFDGYRFTPKGLRALFGEAGFDRVTSYLVEAREYVSAYMTDREHTVTRFRSDCWYVGRKR
jgi:SAM-dependent methyltransferase